MIPQVSVGKFEIPQREWQWNPTQIWKNLQGNLWTNVLANFIVTNPTVGHEAQHGRVEMLVGNKNRCTLLPDADIKPMHINMRQCCRETLYFSWFYFNRGSYIDHLLVISCFGKETTRDKAGKASAICGGSSVDGGTWSPSSWRALPSFQRSSQGCFGSYNKSFRASAELSGIFDDPIFCRSLVGTPAQAGMDSC